MPRRNITVKIEDGKVVFSDEILNYFESIRTEENGVWIDKYFEVLSDENNLSAIKYNAHHIRPCFTFKDKEHKTREKTESLADKVEGNVIKLSVYNHLLAHYFLWKIFDNWNSKSAFQKMCNYKKKIENLSEYELKEIARLREECAKENITKEFKEYRKQWYIKNREYKLKKNKEWNENNKERRKEWEKEYYKNNKDERLNDSRKRYEKNKEKILQRNKEYNKKNEEKLKIYRKKYNESHKEQHSEWNKQYYQQNKEIVSQNHKIYYENNKEKISKKKKEKYEKK